MLGTQTTLLLSCAILFLGSSLISKVNGRALDAIGNQHNVTAYKPNTIDDKVTPSVALTLDDHDEDQHDSFTDPQNGDDVFSLPSDQEWSTRRYEGQFKDDKITGESALPWANDEDDMDDIDDEGY